MARRFVLALRTLGVLALGLVLTAAPVRAHPLVVRAEPADGAVLETAPRRLVLWFSEPIALNMTRIEVVDGEGRRLPATATAGPIEEASGGEATAKSTLVLVIGLPELAPNVYRVSWRTVASNDLHVVAGALVFGVQRAAERAPETAVSPVWGAIEMLFRWIDLAALAAVVGALALVWGVAPAPSAWGERNVGGAAAVYALRRRLLWFAATAALMALGAGVGLVVVQGSAAAGLGEADVDVAAVWSEVERILTTTGYGGRWFVRQDILAGLTMVCLWLAHRAKQGYTGRQHADAVAGRLVTVAVVGLVAGLATTQALSSHAVAFTEFSLLRVAAHALHLTAAGLWAGGLLTAAWVAAPMIRARRGEAMLARAMLGRFGWLAAGSLGGLVVTGLYMSGQQVASLDALLLTLYGQVLMLKGTVVVCVALIGLINAAALHPRMAEAVGGLTRGVVRAAAKAQRDLPRAVRREAATFGVVLGLAAILGTSQPARGPEFDSPRDEATGAVVTTQVEDLVLTAAVKPNRPGQKFVTLGVFNTRRPEPAPIEAVTVVLTPVADPAAAVTLQAAPVGGQRYQIAGEFMSTAGDWRITMQVTRRGMATTTATFAWQILPYVPTVARRSLISDRPLAPMLNGAATASALLGALTVVGWVMSRRLARAQAKPDSGRDFGAAVETRLGGQDGQRVQHEAQV